MKDQPYYYVYILQPLKDENRFYTEFTQDINCRLKDHNSGKNKHTKKFKPWPIKSDSIHRV